MLLWISRTKQDSSSEARSSGKQLWRNYSQEDSKMLLRLVINIVCFLSIYIFNVFCIILITIDSFCLLWYFISPCQLFGSQAVLTGSSAGGLSTFLHCDNFHSLLPNTKRVKCFADGGYFLDRLSINHRSHEWYKCKFVMIPQSLDRTDIS